MLTGSVSRLGGGVSEVIRQLSGALIRRNDVEVLVFAVADAATGSDLPLWQGIPLCVLPGFSPSLFCYSPTLYDAIRKANLDVLNVSCTWLYQSIVSMKWMRDTGRPVVVSPHGDLHPWALNNSRWKKQIAAALFERRHLSRATCLHALTKAEALTFRAFGLQNPIAVVPNGIDMPDSARVPAKRPPWAPQIEEGGRVLLYLGRLHHKKNLTSLLRAWAILERERGESSDWWLAIAGWDQLGHESKLRQEVLNCGGRRVLFVGPQYGSDKDSCFRNSSAFVLPSLSEGLPVAVLEAWSYGLPVLITPECNLPEGTLNGAAIEVSSTIDGLVMGLRRLIQMSEIERTRMGKAGRDLVDRQFSWTTVSGQMLELYLWVLGGGPAPSFVLGSA